MNKKEKCQYTMLGNLGWALKNLWQMDKAFCLTFIPAIPLTILFSFLDSYFPKILLDRLEARETFTRLTVIIVLYAAIRMTATFVSEYLDSRRQARSFTPTGIYQKWIYLKNFSCFYQTAETQEFQKVRERASDDSCHGNCAAEFLWRDIQLLFTDILGIFTFASLLAYLDPVILAVVAATSVISFFTSRWQQKFREKHKDLWEKENRKKGYLSELSNNFAKSKDIRLYGMQGWIEKIHSDYKTYVLMWETRCSRRGMLASILSSVMSLLQNGTAYIVLIGMLLGGELSVGDFVFFFGITESVSVYLGGVISHAANVIERAEKIQYYREFLDYSDNFNHGVGAPLPAGAPKIELRDVWFKYDGAEDFTLKGIDLTISPGEKLALVGMNGAGKTTLVKLICGFYMPTKGKILVDGKPITDYNIDEYYSLISAVFQDIYIYAVRISEFVASSDIATSDRDERVKAALISAGLGEKIASLEHGTETYLVNGIYPGGIDLSGGETQKLLLARAIYKDGSILVLDEPTNALDPIAENELYMKYNSLTEGKTSLYISHRFASTRFCDRIVLLENGKLAEIGSHRELMALNGKYAEMFNIQSRYYKEGKVNA